MSCVWFICLKIDIIIKIFAISLGPQILCGACLALIFINHYINTHYIYFIKFDFLKIQLWTAVTRSVVSSKLEVVNIMTTSIASTWRTDMAVSACAHLLQFSLVLCLPYQSIRFNDLYVYLIQIYTPSKTHHSVHINVYGVVVLVQVCGPYHMMVFCCMVL